MSHPGEKDSGHPRSDAELLGNRIAIFQQAWIVLIQLLAAERIAPLDAEQAAYKQVVQGEMAAAIDALYYALAPDLHRLAKGWVKSQQFQHIAATSDFAKAVETLALSAFSAIVEALPLLKVDPERNVRGLLITIARRDLFDQEKIYSSNRREQSRGQQVPATGERDSAMWWSAHEMRGGEHAAAEPKDPASGDFEERILADDQLRSLWPHVLECWQQTLPSEDLWLIIMRWFHDPPLPFKEIAELLGAGWSEAAVKQRHYRILRRTKTYLQAQGLLDGSDVGG